MKGVIALALIMIGGFLIYEVVSGHAIDIINTIRPATAGVPPPDTGVWGDPKATGTGGRTV